MRRCTMQRTAWPPPSTPTGPWCSRRPTGATPGGPQPRPSTRGGLADFFLPVSQTCTEFVPGGRGAAMVAGRLVVEVGQARGPSSWLRVVSPATRVASPPAIPGDLAQLAATVAEEPAAWSVWQLFIDFSSFVVLICHLKILSTLTPFCVFHLDTCI